MLFHVIGTWNLPLIDRDEPRFAEAAREMHERGDYVIPYFNNHFRFDKPPFTYWAQIASYKIFGENDFAARFPSVIAAALTAFSIFVWGSRIGGEKLGWWAAIIFTLSLQTFVHAKAAVADMWLVLFVTIAHWAGYELLFASGEKRPTSNVQRSTPNEKHTAPDSVWWWLFYVALALAFLAKGPIGWAPLVTMVAAALSFARKRDAQFSFLTGTIVTFGGIILMLGIIAIWGIPALIRTQGEYFSIGIGRHVISRSIATMEGHGADSLSGYLLLLPFYFVTIFVSFFPWSVKLPWLAIRLRRNRDPLDTYLITGAATIFLIFTLVKTKLPHYTLPAFPLLVLLLARSLAAENSMRFVKNSAVTAGAIYVAIAFVVPPLVAHLFPARDLFQKSRDYLRPAMEFGAVEFTEPSLVWYFRSRTNGWMTTLRPRDVQRFMEQTGARFVIVPSKSAGEIYPALPADWKRFSTHGFNIVKGKRVDLTLILKPE